MINTDKNHKHIYDAQGKQLCCTQEEKIYTKAGAKNLIQNDDCCSTKKQAHEEHSDDDGHDHSGGNEIQSECFARHYFIGIVAYCHFPVWCAKN